MIYEILYNCISINNKYIRLLLENSICYLIPYGFLAYIGYDYIRLDKETKNKIIIFSGLIFIICSIYYFIQYNNFTSMQIAKYPPRLYYISYGIFISSILLYICENKELKIYTNSFVCFISSHSLWIYLWHIVALEILDYFQQYSINLFLQLLFILIFSSGMTFLQEKIVTSIEGNNNFAILKYFKQ